MTHNGFNFNVRMFRASGEEVFLNEEGTGYNPPLSPPIEMQLKFLEEHNACKIQEYNNRLQHAN